MSISSLGVGSGLDLGGLVDQLVAAERAPTETRLTRRELELTGELSGFSRVAGALGSLTGALEQLETTDDYALRTASSSAPTNVTISAEGTADTGTYSLVVDRLAQRHRLGSAEINLATQFGGNVGDSITIDVAGESHEISLETAVDLQGLRDSITSVAGESVEANLITTQADTGVLVIGSRESGADNAVTVTFAGTLTAGDLQLAMLNEDANGAALATTAELDASLTIDGYTVTRSSNRIDDLLVDTVLTLGVADPETTVTVAVNEDPDTVVARVQDVVSRYNTLFDITAELTAYGGENAPSGALLGDSTIRGLENALGSVFSGTSDAFSELGFSFSSSGAIVIDTATLRTALTDNQADTAEALSGSTGLFTTLGHVVDGFADSETGLIADRTDGLDRRLEDIADQRLELDERIISLEERLVRRFSALDALVAQLNSTSSFLQQQLANLPGSGSRPGA